MARRAARVKRAVRAGLAALAGGLALRTAFAAIEQFERARGDEGEKGRRYGCRGSGSEQKEGEPQPEENDLVNDSVHEAIIRCMPALHGARPATSSGS